MKLANFMLANHDIEMIKLFSRPLPTYVFDIYQVGRYQGSVQFIAKTNPRAIKKLIQYMRNLGYFDTSGDIISTDYEERFERKTREEKFIR